MYRLSPEEEAQRLKDLEAIRRAPIFIKTRRGTCLGRSGAPDEANMLEAKARLNAYAPISQLPNETLAEIFMALKDHPESSFEDLHRLAQICGRWRRVAISTPTLWTDLPTGRHNYTLLMLERSRKAPLDVHFCQEIPPATINAALAQIERIRSLTLDVPNEVLINAQDFLLNTTTHSANALDELIIKTRYYPWSPTFPNFTFNAAAFRLTKSLRHLHLSGVKFDFQFLTAAPHLTHLVLEKGGTVPVSGKAFMAILQPMTKLERLHISLEGVNLEEISSSTPAATELIQFHFPYLVELGLESGGKHDQIVHFLRRSKLPRLRQLQLRCHFLWGMTLYNFSSLIQAATTTLENGCFGAPEELDVSRQGFNIKFNHNDGFESAPSASIILTRTSDIRCSQSDYPILADLMACIARLDGGPESSLRRLTFPDNAPLLSRDEFVRLFGSLTHLEHIEIFMTWLSNLIDNVTVGSDTSSNSPLMFPALKSIRWVKCDRYCPGESDPELSTALQQYLTQRRERGSPIETLDLWGCYNPEEIDQWRSMVDTLTVVNRKIL